MAGGLERSETVALKSPYMKMTLTVKLLGALASVLSDDVFELVMPLLWPEAVIPTWERLEGAMIAVGYMAQSSAAMSSVHFECVACRPGLDCQIAVGLHRCCQQGQVFRRILELRPNAKCQRHDHLSNLVSLSALSRFLKGNGVLSSPMLSDALVVEKIESLISGSLEDADIDVRKVKLTNPF
jgi:hypothetical protein